MRIIRGAPECLRRIRFKDPHTGKTLVFITNQRKLPAATICALYKSRWQVELFFKWIKQHLRIKKFYGTSENAVRTQIWIAGTKDDKSMPKPMRAIVLTFDRNRVLTEHMIACYASLWPDHPLIFRIPYQLDAGEPSPRREYVQCPSAIKATALALLEDIGDDEWIYWCIDDKYPIDLNVWTLNMIVQWIMERNDPSVSGVLLCRARRMLDPAYLSGRAIQIGDQALLERKAYQQIWLHQFVRAGVIRHMFTQFPDVIEKAHIMDQLKSELVKPSWQRLYVTERNHSVFGESTTRGIITANCRESILRHGMALPDHFGEEICDNIIIGKMQPLG